MKERALELAKKLEWYSNYPEFVEAGEMIRRLVEELDKLEKDLALKTRDRDVFCDFTLAYEKRIKELDKQSEPVAWTTNGQIDWLANKNNNTAVVWNNNNPTKMGVKEDSKIIPLYTTPQTKPLSDEEITVLWHKAMGLATSDENLKNNISHASLFARAIEERHGIK